MTSVGIFCPHDILAVKITQNVEMEVYVCLHSATDKKQFCLNLFGVNNPKRKKVQNRENFNSFSPDYLDCVSQLPCSANLDHLPKILFSYNIQSQHAYMGVDWCSPKPVNIVLYQVT